MGYNKASGTRAEYQHLSMHVMMKADSPLIISLSTSTYLLISLCSVHTHLGGDLEVGVVGDEGLEHRQGQERGAGAAALVALLGLDDGVQEGGQELRHG